jgi:putative ABC transport system permease protein
VTAQICGHELRSAFDAPQEGHIHLSAANENIGIFIVPDNVVSEADAATDFVFGKYGTDDKAQVRESNERLNDAVKSINEAEKDERKDAPEEALDDSETSDSEAASSLSGLLEGVGIRTKLDVYTGVMAIGALLCFIGMYIGAVFLVTCGAILALRGLSDAVDSASRYETLRRIGVDKGDLHRSLLKQTAFFFMLPLLVAGMHSVFGMKFMAPLLSMVGINQIGGSVASTIGIILAIYGGYFLITYIGSWRIIREKK